MLDSGYSLAGAVVTGSRLGGVQFKLLVHGQYSALVNGTFTSNTADLGFDCFLWNCFMSDVVNFFIILNVHFPNSSDFDGSSLSISVSMSSCSLPLQGAINK